MLEAEQNKLNTANRWFGRKPESELNHNVSVNFRFLDSSAKSNFCVCWNFRSPFFYCQRQRHLDGAKKRRRDGRSTDNIIHFSTTKKSFVMCSLAYILLKSVRVAREKEKKSSTSEVFILSSHIFVKKSLCGI